MSDETIVEPQEFVFLWIENGEPHTTKINASSYPEACWKLGLLHGDQFKQREAPKDFQIHFDRGHALVSLLVILAAFIIVWSYPLPLYVKFLGTLLIIVGALVIQIICDLRAENRDRRRSERGQVNLLQTRRQDHPSVLHKENDDSHHE